MAGVSGTSKTGITHRYYHCRKAKAKKACDKKRVQKDLIENIVLDYTLEMLNDDAIIDYIVDTCFKLQSNSSTKLPSMQSRLKQIEKELSNIMKAIKQGILHQQFKLRLTNLKKKRLIWNSQ